MNTTGTRFKGTLKKWDVERGFGFVAAEQGGQDIFVHVSAFPRDGHQPIVGEPLSFEIERDRDGRKRGVRVQRPGIAQPSSSAGSGDARVHERTHRRRFVQTTERSPRSFRTRVIVLLLVAAMAGYAYDEFARAPTPRLSVAAPAETSANQPSPPPSTFQCDGRQHCSQMTSCDEARYFLKNCPGTQMDGNNDGVPCERQWCGGG